MCNNITYVQICLENTHQLHLLLPPVITAGKCSAEKQMCVPAELLPISLVLPRVQGWVARLCACCASVPTCQHSLWWFATAWGSTEQHLNKISPLGRSSWLPQRGIPPASRCSWRSPASTQLSWLWTAIKLTIMCLLMSLTAAHSATILDWLFLPCHPLTYNFKLHIKSFHPSPTKSVQ